MLQIKWRRECFVSGHCWLKFRVSQYMSIYVFKCLPILDQSINVKIAILNLNDPKINDSLLQFVQVIYCVQKLFRTTRFQKREYLQLSRDNQQKIIVIYDNSVLVSQTAHNILLFYGILNCVSQKNLQFSPILEINCAEDEIS